MENAIKIIAIGKGGYEEGAVESQVITFKEYDDDSFPGLLLMETVAELRQKIIDQETINAKLKNKKK